MSRDTLLFGQGFLHDPFFSGRASSTWASERSSRGVSGWYIRASSVKCVD